MEYIDVFDADLGPGPWRAQNRFVAERRRHIGDLRGDRVKEAIPD